MTEALPAVDFARLGPAPGFKLVVTGGAGGIGRRLVQVAVRTGLRVAVIDLAASLAQAPPPPGVLAVRFDATDEGATAAAFAEVAGEWGGAIDGLVHLPGFMNRKAPVADLTLAEIDEVLSVNLRSAFLAARAALPLMRASACASLVFAASGLATLVEPATTTYAAAKAGIIALAKGLAKENAPRIRANCIAPGAVDTAFLRGGTGRDAGPNDPDFALPGGRAAMLGTIPLGRIAVVDDVVGPILFLLSDKARFMTGQTLYINGGRLMV